MRDSPARRDYSAFWALVWVIVVMVVVGSALYTVASLYRIVDIGDQVCVYSASNIQYATKGGVDSKGGEILLGAQATEGLLVPHQFYVDKVRPGDTLLPRFALVNRGIHLHTVCVTAFADSKVVLQGKYQLGPGDSGGFVIIVPPDTGYWYCSITLADD